MGGFDQQNGCFLGYGDFPSANAPGPQWSIGVRRRVAGRIGARAIAGGGTLGWSFGLGDSGSVTRNWSSTSVGALLTIELPPVFWLGAGPVVAWLRSGRGAPGGYASDSGWHAIRGGIRFEAGVRSSARKPAFFSLSASYRLVPRRSEGPYALDHGYRELPPFEANYSLLTIGAGVGARFRLP